MVMSLAPRLGSLKWVAFSVLAGLAVPGILLVVITFLFPGYPDLLLILVGLPIILALPLMVVPFLALRPHWPWWPASLAGLFVGLIGGFLVRRFVFDIPLFCLRVCAPHMQDAPTSNALELVATLAVMGLLQALTLPGIQRQIGWFATTLVGAFAFVYGFIGIAVALGGTSARPANLWVAIFLAGAFWGIIAGTGLTILRSQPQAVGTAA